MNDKLVESIANAVLYEGYMLYPYRPSSVKNRQRWNFGVLYPKSYSEIQNGSDPWFTQTECLVRAGEATSVEIKIRFLHAISRQVAKAAHATAERSQPNAESGAAREAETAESGTAPSWQEAAEREVSLPAIPITDLLTRPVTHLFSFSGSQKLSKENQGAPGATVIRSQEPVMGSAEISAVKSQDGVFKLTVLVSNATTLLNPRLFAREEVLLRSLLSAHTVLHASDGEFVSLTDPPAELKEIASQCKNIGTWPVLVGEEPAADTILSSPIILSDYPQIAPESPGDLFDGTEIDEILALRILTLTDDEKREMRQSDQRAREVLERTESLPAEHFLKLHGVLRGMKPVDNGPGGGSGDGEVKR